MRDVAIQVEQLSKRYKLGEAVSFSLRDSFSGLFSRKNKPVEGGYFNALENVSFEVKKGEVLGIIGKNGAGKSTLLKILSRITKPTSGRIEINGRVSSLLEVGTGFHPELTGRENIFLNGTILGMRKAEIKSKFDQIVDFSGVEKFIDTPVKYYSSGMYVRLAFAVAAHLEPEILIIDEVLAVGDAEFQKKCLGKMKDVSGEGRTVLFVSHDMAAIKTICPQSMLLVNGTVKLHGATEYVVDKYIHEISLKASSQTTGTGQVSLSKLMILDAEGKQVNQLNTFDFVRVKATYSVHESISKVSFALCFNSMDGERITSIWSSYINQSFDFEKGTYEIDFEIPQLKLIPGDYELISYIESQGLQIERIDALQFINIGYTKNHGLVQIPIKSQGRYVENFNFQLKEIKV